MAEIVKNKPQQENQEKKLPISERIWLGANKITLARLAEAEKALATKEIDVASNRYRQVQLAHGHQKWILENADTESLTTAQLTANQISLAMLGMPAAYKAEIQLQDPSKKRSDRIDALQTISGFNSEISSTLHYMPPNMFAGFQGKFFNSSQEIMSGLGLDVLSSRDFDRIMKGMETEVAFFRALYETLPENWSVRQSTIQEDLMGVDIKVTNPEGKTLNIDTKNNNGFFEYTRRLIDNGRISSQQAERALEAGYYTIKDERGVRQGMEVHIINASRLGEIRDFRYQDPGAVTEFAEKLLEEPTQQPLRKLGGTAIT